MKWCLVDERDDHREQFAQLLRNHGVEVETRAPDPSFRVTTTATGFILDYALHEKDAAIPYSGATLAAQIRQEFPDRPIVILSAFLRDPATNVHLRRTRDLIDLKVKKDEVEQVPERFARQLHSLATGYERIRGVLQRVEDPQAAARAILGLNQEVEHTTILKEVIAYLAQVGRKEVALTAHLLLHELLKFPGPLLRPEYAAVILGIDPRDGQEETLSQYLEPALYRGAFDDLQWAGERQIPLYWRSFLSDLRASLPNLSPALCFICQQAASTLCAECGKLVDGRHSLPAQRGDVTYPECRQARVCGNCLRKGELQSEVVLDPRHAVLQGELVKETRQLLKKARKRPDADMN